MQQIQVHKQSVKRIDECAREYEAAQYEETLSRARRASRKAVKASARAQALLSEIEWVLS